jgi:hypothetical protein
MGEQLVLAVVAQGDSEGERALVGENISCDGDTTRGLIRFPIARERCPTFPRG